MEYQKQDIRRELWIFRQNREWTECMLDDAEKTCNHARETFFRGLCEAVAEHYDYIDEILLDLRLRTEGWKEPWLHRSSHPSELMADDYAGEQERGQAAPELGIPRLSNMEPW
mgnify:CR=1 FL=1